MKALGLFRSLAVGGVATLIAAGLMLPGCTDAPISATVRSLHTSGPVSFLCLDSNQLDGASAMARPLEDCTGARTADIYDFSIPHLYAMITQVTTGEVAVVDLTTDSDHVIDQDPAVPGANHLPIGTQPTAIVSTPGSMATFVAVGEPRYEAIYAMPSDMVRHQAPNLSDWPACRLPFAPGEMTLALDPPNDDGETRPCCEAAYGAPEQAAECAAEGSGGAGGAEPANDCALSHCHGDLSLDAAAVSTPGRYKLVVTLPSEGGFAVIDAQSILDQPAGAHEPCVIERWVPLKVELPPPPEEPPEPPQSPDWCANEPLAEGPYADAFVSLPAGIAHDGSRLYVADMAAPVIHRIEMATPCEPLEIPPLVASSTEDPERIVTTSRIAVSPLTLDLERYLYAIDHVDGSIMAFDISDGSDVTRPLVHQGTADNPFQPTDRVRFNTPPRDIVILQHQTDSVDEQTGSTLPVRCDPTSDSSPGAEYQTSSTYDSGAGPYKLRGVFAFAVLASGDIVVIDIDDYDAPCRGPKENHPLFGCGQSTAILEGRSEEYSCNVVAPHQTRAERYLLTTEGVANAQPGIAAWPTLFDLEGTLIPLDDDEVSSPRMRATVPVDRPNEFNLVVGSDIRDLSPTGLLLSGTDPDNPSQTTDVTEHTLVANLTDPRAHILDQNWSVTYEGKLPGFAGRFGALLDETDGGRVFLSDPSSQFCSKGVLSHTAVLAELEDQSPDLDPALIAPGLADYVQVTSSLPAEDDDYWDSGIWQGGSDEPQDLTCDFQACELTYGTAETPKTPRDYRIVEAWQDGLELVPRHGRKASAPALKCCFPSVVEFSVRGGNQWILYGDVVGFLHNVTTNDDGLCRKSCDPQEVLLNGRVREVPAGATPEDGAVPDDHPLAFRNPFFRFAINCDECGLADHDGKASTPDEWVTTSDRDMSFSFTTQGAFRALSINTATGSLQVQPTRATFLSPTNELVISDGTIEGITFVDLHLLTVTRQYF